MKKILLLTSLFISFVLTAQTPQWVSTTPSNKKVVLEEYTGQKCQYCPDGHKIASALKASNAGNVFLINIHSGGYATPDANYPMDLRTTVGTALDGASGLAGYPAGSVNRAKSPWAENRGAWGTSASTIMGQSSPVNVYVKSVVDPATRVLTTEVEVYYTSAGTGTSNKLSVALIQNNILGKQIDGGNFNPTNWYNGQYIHSHVLRMHLTSGTYGESLDTLTSGKYYYRKYTTTLPANIGNVPVDIYNLAVVAFVAEGNSNIVSGNEADVTYSDPKKVDLGMVDQSILPIKAIGDPNTHWCDTKLTPKAEVTNNSTTTITSFTMTATVNGVPTTKTYTGSLTTGQKTVVDFGQLSVVGSAGFYSYKLEGFTNINNDATVSDVKVLNNAFQTNLIGFKSNAFASFKQSFDSTAIVHTVIDNTENPNASIMSYTNPTGAQGTVKALRIPLLDVAPYSAGLTSTHIVIGEADFRTATTASLDYYYAYSQGVQTGTAPSVVVSYSTDCGTNWTDIKSNACVSTGTAAAGYFYVPVSADYKLVTVDLAAVKGKSVMLRITGKAGTDGNTLYLDQINITSNGTATGGGGGPVVTYADTFHKALTVNATTVDNQDVTGGLTLTKDSMYTWSVKDVTKLFPGWTMASICDNVNCYDYPATTSQDFKALGSKITDILKVNIKHDLISGYGYVVIDVQEKGKPATAKSYKVSLKVSGGTVVDPNAIIGDTAKETVYEVTKATVDNKDVKATYQNLSLGDTVKWKVVSASGLPSGWSITSITDNKGTYTYAATLNKSFPASSTSSANFLNINFKHAKKEGMASLKISTFRTKDSAKTAKVLNVHLITKASAAPASISIVTDENSKLLNYFERSIYIDEDFKGNNLVAFDMNGKKVLDTKINTSSIDFNQAKGIYILNVMKNGEVIRSNKVSVE